MPSLARLVAIRGNDLQNVCFRLAFAAPELSEPVAPASAVLEFGDGERAKLGWLVMPSSATWREQRELTLITHTYAGLGPYTARLLWGTLLLGAEISPTKISGLAQDESTADEPAATLFAIESREGRTMERSVRLQASRPEPGQRLRLDGGTGQVFWLEDEAGPDRPSERRFAYYKTGIYTVALDLLDADGFWLRTYAEQPVEISVWPDQTGQAGVGERALTGDVLLRTGDQPGSLRANPQGGEQGHIADDTDDACTALPWLPFSYVRPMWGWLRTYTSPRGTNVARVLAAGTYLSIHAETRVGDELWFQTAGGDWISAAIVESIHPSALRGVALPGPKPDARQVAGVPQAIVAASLLNERATPGVRADNPPLSQLPFGTSVEITDRALCGDSIWYQVENRGWVQGTGLRFMSSEREVSQPDPVALPLALPAGWVTAPLLNVRARPGITEDNPPIDCLGQDQVIPILESCAIGSSTWYRVGTDRWVEGTWVSIATPVRRPVPIGPDERWLAVNRSSQTAVAYEGDHPVYVTLASTGLSGTPTPGGLFRIERQVPAGRISGGNPALGNYYDLEDVPWISYFYGGYAILGAYWHTGFGRPRSHGCVNLSPYDAWWIYRWAQGEISVYIY